MANNTSPDKIAQEIFDEIKSEDIGDVTNCMTRLRLKINSPSEKKIAALKKIGGVLGVNVSGDELQIILGPGRAAAVAKSFISIKNSDTGKNASPFDGDALHQKIREQNNTPIKNLFRKIASVFLPLIPAFIACGLLTGLLNIALKINPALGSFPIVRLLGVIGNTAFYCLNIMAGWNAGKEFGAAPALTASLAALMQHPSLSSVTLLGSTLTPGRGGIIAVLIVAAFASFIERKIRRIIPETFDLFVTPLLTLIISGLAAILVLQPIGGMASDLIFHVATAAVETGGAIAGALMAGFFLPCVMLGIHQLITPIHAELIARDGVTVLLPILAMAGAGQVGASIAVYARTKNKALKKTILSALPVGMMGVGEPLIYGVTLPLLRPFIGACIGASFGGAIAASSKVGAMTLGISGLPLAAATDNPVIYLAGVAASYVAGFIATWLLGFDDPE